MTEKRSILLLASATALTLVLHESALSAPPVDKPTAPTAATTFTAEPTMAANPTPAPAPEVEKTPDADKPTAVGSKTTPPAASEQDTESPWASRYKTRYGRGPVTAEERKARWERKLKKMRERATQRHRDIQETTERWDAYWKTLDAMTPEQKEAIYAIFDRGHKRCSCRTMGQRTPPDMPRPPRWRQPEYDFPVDPPFSRPGYDYGYGPARVQPHPFERNPAPFFK
ncbi:MAG: hypothetical protein LGR52_09680 [Candidatus Thiosymbion ectosymbiont of Robbea hypermnestra]|nr:hypothetical protein [Candidatus Thiosymbion ectosymbiont of Robbea hypermnestra]